MGTVDTWLMWQLSGGATFATAVTNASRTLLYDIEAGCWSQQMCDLLSVPVGALAQVRPSSGRFGVTADTTALGPGIALSGVAGDQQAALFGQGCHSPGMAKNTYGTGSFVLMNVGRSCPAPAEGLLTTVAWDLGDGAVYALEGSIFATGAAVGWLTGVLAGADDPATVESLAASVPDSGGVVVVPAFAGLGSPWWDPSARGAVMGLTFATQPAHIARATIESMALQTRDVTEAMTQATAAVASADADGGAEPGAVAGTGAAADAASGAAADADSGAAADADSGAAASADSGAAASADSGAAAGVGPGAARSAAGRLAELRVDGGAAVNNLLCSIQADQLGVAVCRPALTQTTALGAAMLAGLAEGVWSSPAEVAALWRLDRRFEPSDDRSAADALHRQWRRGLARARQWAPAGN